ncbi:acyl-CoA dehydrogenase [Variovorax paradoxus]|uniref:Acyl-CoA dehydrogenase n=1 Tax=Variovorax paradoxus TaxID=34073 RepID=A0A5Q0M6J3_VARPD|nr:acyl-CoA dehydrogenase [Variovorax paradoxus]QFZ85109.1 acyl-CoA dehydrogenase [Variovorax paradoxus]
MDLNYSDDQLMLRESADRFLSERHQFEHFRKIEAAGTAFDEGIWRAFAHLGWLGLPISERNGGLGGGAIETAIVAEALGKSLVLAPYVSAVVLAGGLMDELGTSAQCNAVLGPLVEGAGIAVLAHDERRMGVTMAGIDTMAVRASTGAGYRIDGHKTMVLGGAGARTFLVTARVDQASHGAARVGVFIVPSDARGVAVKPFRTADGGLAADVSFAGVAVEGDALLGGCDDASAALRLALDRAAAAVCWDAVGAMDALLAATVEFTKQRVQFGKPLSSFQALQHRMAEMAVKCTEARATALLASLSLEAPEDWRVRGVSGAKAKIGKISRDVAHEAIQLHGAMGFSDELPVGWWFKRLFVFENLFGSTGQHLERYRRVVSQPEFQAESLLRSPALAPN